MSCSQSNGLSVIFLSLFLVRVGRLIFGAKLLCVGAVLKSDFPNSPKRNPGIYLVTINIYVYRTAKQYNNQLSSLIKVVRSLVTFST